MARDPADPRPPRTPVPRRVLLLLFRGPQKPLGLPPLSAAARPASHARRPGRLPRSTAAGPARPRTSGARPPSSGAAANAAGSSRPAAPSGLTGRLGTRHQRPPKQRRQPRLQRPPRRWRQLGLRGAGLWGVRMRAAACSPPAAGAQAPS
ncbi:Hypothetical predicted protein, partial [Marmota monax]